VGWALLAARGGGIDPGDGLGGRGPTAALLALAIGAPLAAAAVVAAWGQPALRAWPSRLALGAMAAIAAWAALSITWAAGPDLAWIDANRQLIGLCALAIGLGVACLLPRAPLAFGLGLSAAAGLPVLLALGSRVFPDVLGPDRGLARLGEPVGYPNGLALVAVMAVPGLLWLAAAETHRPWALPVAGAGLCAVAVTILMSYSRGGLLALAMAAAVTIAMVPGRGRALAAVVAGGVGAAWPAAYALSDPILTADGLPADLREGAGTALGWRLALGLAVAAALAPLIVRAWPRLGLGGRRGKAVAAGAAIALCLAVAVGAAASSGARDWAGDRVSEFRGEDGSAVSNDPGRLVNAGANQRKAWWEEAWRGFEDSPVVGQGAGGFSLVHLQERRSGDGALNTREAHGVVPAFLSGMGFVGLALLAILVGAVVWGVLRAVDRTRDPALALPLAVMAAFALQAAVDWSWSIPALVVPALGAAGVVLAAASPGPVVARRRPGAVAAAGLAALTLVGIASATLPWLSAEAVASGQDALAAGRPRDALSDADRARTLNPLSLEPVLLRAGAYSDLGELGRALGSYEEGTRVQPDDPASWRALAIFLGDDPRAAAAWREVRRLDPQDPEAALRAGG
jgi:hypothetical protein